MSGRRSVAPRPELSDAAVVSRSWGMAVATLVSRLTGFIRIVLLAAILGAALSSAFSVANQLPNQVAALVLEATFTAIFVPVLARAERDDADGGAAFVRRLVTLSTALLLVATLVSVLAAPLLVRLMLGGDPQVNEPLTTAFAYLLLPQVIFYGLSSVFMAILNNRNIFGPPAWAPVVNNVVAIITLGVYLAVPGELSVDPVRMGNAKLLVLGIGTTAGVVAQAAVLLAAIGRERISLRPLWGLDARLKRFGAMAAAMVLYVLISQIGLVVANQVASTAAASGPAIYNYTWLLLQLPFGIIGVTVLTVVMPRLSRNAAADDTPAVLADLSLATRLTMVTLIPIVALMTVGGPAIGSALFAYGNFGDVDAGYLGAAVSLSAFTLIPYALVLLQLRVFYAREQPWTPIVIVVVITIVKIIGSLAAPHLTDNRDLVAAYLGLANGIGFLAGAVVGHYLLRRALLPPGGLGAPPARGGLLSLGVVRTILVAAAASLLAGLIGFLVDQLLGVRALTTHGGVGSLLRLLVLAALMGPIVAVVLLRAKVPEAQAALAAVRRSRRTAVGVDPFLPRTQVTYAKRDNPLPSGAPPDQEAIRQRGRGPQGVAKGPEVTDSHSDKLRSGRGRPASAGRPRRQPAADSFQPDVGGELSAGAVAASGPPPHPVGEPSREPVAFDGPSVPDSASAAGQLVPGVGIADGRYRLLIFHGGAPALQFWQALDTALDRQVALTFVDPDGTMPDDDVHEILSRTMRLSRFDLPGIARVLDVVHTGTGGLVVAEWIRGGSLQEVADTAPSPAGAARAVQSLAAAAEAAHRAGVALSIDHPSRVRVSIEGDVALAFPATLPDASPEDDIRGIGATLYALLVNRWPLPASGTRSGLPPAEQDTTGQPLEPRVVDPDIPFQISAAAAHSLSGDGGIRSASTLLNLLEQAPVAAEPTDLLSPIDEPVESVRSRSRSRMPDVTERTQRRRGMLIAAGVGVAVLAVAAIAAKLMMGGIGGGNGSLGDIVNPHSSAGDSTATSGTVTAGSTVKVVRATVFPPDNDGDAPSEAGKAVDGNTATYWPTDTYDDAVPFPGFKKGVGLLLQLAQPTVVGTVTIDISSTGTKVQIRSASTANPTKLDDTTALTPEPVSLNRGTTTINVPAAAATSTVLVWITTLGQTGGKSQADVREITVKAAA